MPEWTELEYQCRNWYHFSWLSGDDVHAVARAQPRQGIVGDARGAAGESARARGPLGVVRADLRRHVRLTIRSSTEYANNTRLYAFWLPGHRRSADGAFRLRVWHQGSRVAAELFHRGEKNWDFSGKPPNPYKARASEFFAGIRSGKLINLGAYMPTAPMVAILGQIVCYTGRQLGWKKARPQNFAFSTGRRESISTSSRRSSPGPTAEYPIAIPGNTKLIAGT